MNRRTLTPLAMTGAFCVIAFATLPRPAKAPNGLTIPFGKTRETVIPWALQHGLSVAPDFNNNPTRILFTGCLMSLPNCQHSRLRFVRGNLTSITMSFAGDQLKSAPIKFFQRIKAFLQKTMGDPWFDRERVLGSAPITAKRLSASGQALVTSWTDFRSSTELRLDVGSTEGNLLRLVLRPYGSSGSPASRKTMGTAILVGNTGDNTLMKLAMEKAADDLRRASILRPHIKRLGHSPLTRLSINKAQVDKLLTVSHAFVTDRARQSFRRTGLVNILPAGDSRQIEITITVNFRRRNDRRLMLVRIKDQHNKKLWATTVDVDVDAEEGP